MLVIVQPTVHVTDVRDAPVVGLVVVRNLGNVSLVRIDLLAEGSQVSLAADK